MSNACSADAAGVCGGASLKKRLGACAECGGSFERRRAGDDFCCTGCRKTFGNRRMKRGAELYDLMMAVRFERSTAQALGVWQAMCRMAYNFRAEDQAQRAGRRSWRPAKEVLQERPHLKAIHNRMRIGR